MDMETQDSKGPGKNKRQWTEEEDEKLIEALLDLFNEGKFNAEGGFKSGFYREVEKKLAISLPNARLKVEPHIKSRMKTLKTNFSIVHDMLAGHNTSGFGFDAARNCVVAEKLVWDAYLQTHKKAAPFKDKSFSHYRELCVIFGNDRAIGKDAETPADVVEELDTENAQGCDENSNDISTSFAPPFGENTSEVNSKKRKRKSEIEGIIYEVLEKSTKIISSTMESTANRLSLAIEDATVNDLKLQLNKELMKLHGLSVIERHKATIKIGCDRDLIQIFFTIDDDEKEAWVKAVLSKISFKLLY